MTMSSTITVAGKQSGREMNIIILSVIPDSNIVRMFRRRDGVQIANYRVSAELRCVETTR